MVVEALNRGHTVRFGYEARCARHHEQYLFADQTLHLLPMLLQHNLQ